MLRSEAVGIIKRGLGFRQTQDAAIIAALKQTQRDLEAGKTLPEWLVTYAEPLATPAGVATVALPLRFLRLHEEYPPYYLNSSGAKVWLPRKNAIEATEAYPLTSNPSGTVYPHVTVFQASNIVLVPAPSAALTIYLTYYRGADVLDTDIENLWLANAANYLIGLAGVFIAGDLRDAGAASKFTMMAKSGAQAYLGNIVDDELMGRPLIMGRNN